MPADFLNTPLASSLPAGFVGPPAASQVFTVGGALGAAGIGAFGGGILAQLMGGNQLAGAGLGALGAAAGGAIGTSIGGTLLGIGAGPVGIALGTLAGGLLGGLFGSRPSVGPIGDQRIELDGGRLRLGPAYFAKIAAVPPAVVEQARLAIDTVNRLADALGLDLASAGEGAIRFGGTGRGDQRAAFGLPPGRELALTAEAFVLDLLRRPDAFRNAPPALTDALAGVGSLEGASAAIDTFIAEREQLRRALDAMAAGTAGLADSVERAAEAVGGQLRAQIDHLRDRARRFALDAGDVDGAIRAALDEEARRAILALTDPLAHALERLEADQRLRRAAFAEVGADLVQLERLFALERRQVQEQALGAMQADLRGFLDGV